MKRNGKMIILILAVIGVILGVVLGFVIEEIEEGFMGAILFSIIGAVIGIVLCLIADFIPFEEEKYLAYTTEMTDFEPIGKDEDSGRITYQYTDRNGIPVEFKPSPLRVTMEYVDEDFRIETYKTRFTNKHVDYLLPSINKEKHHTIYRKGE